MDIFCKIIQGEIPSKTIYEDNIVKVLLDVSPRHPGHTLIIPKEHYLDLQDINLEVLTHIMEVAYEKVKKYIDSSWNNSGSYNCYYYY